MKPAIVSSGRIFSRLLIFLLLASLTLWKHGVFAEATKSPLLKALILSGGTERDWRGSTTHLRQLLEDSGRFEVRLDEAPQNAAANSFQGFDVVIVDTGGLNLGEGTVRALKAFANRGKGIALTSGTLPDLGPRLNLLKSPGIAATNAPFQRFQFKSLLPDHPVLRGLTNSWRTADRAMRGFDCVAGSAILAADEGGAPVLFAVGLGKGRVFGTSLGADGGSMQEPAFTTTFLRGAEWAASGEATMPALERASGSRGTGIRLLVITGGHDYETSFFKLFEGEKELGWVPVSDTKIAFQQDIRGKYDVLLFYDFTRDLDEKAKANLRAFVESGKGIVVLHHGILDFQNWPWWYEEVVGGLYRLDRKGNVPNSTVKFGQQHFITPAGKHPITDGIEPFEVTDETYKGLFISDKNTPLLLTDNATSDRTVAWVGPCATSRVVFIQLGHDHSPFQHPSYRALIHNSILWTAGKLN